MSAVTPQQIDALLPQTQCGMCGFKGCMPYAEALADNNSSIDLCPPGGVKGLLELADLLNQDATPFIPAMLQKAKPPQKAVIREAECIGCAKCIQACPVDAILGSGKNMHTVIAIECTGCELCVAPCPVDCIDIQVQPSLAATEEKHRADQARLRYNARQKRLTQTPAERKLKDKRPLAPTTLADKQAFIQAAILRAKTKKDKLNP
jgi:electron transport complex protein RnfB